MTLSPDAFTPDTAASARTSSLRERRLADKVTGLLPPHLETRIDLRIVPEVDTGFIMPADADSLADGTDLSREDAAHLAESIDGEYLIAITGQATDTRSLPISDQLTADRAFQFGTALHELLHLLMTNVSGQAAVLEREIDDSTQIEKADELLNIVEDGAIEAEARRADAFTDQAETQLTVIRYVVSTTVEEIPDGTQFSFWDAVTAALYDYAIFPGADSITHIGPVLADPDDQRVTFQSDVDRAAFCEIHEPLRTLANDIHSIRNTRVEGSIRLYEKEASVRRAERVAEFWNAHLAQYFEGDENDSADESPSQPEPSQENAQNSADQGTNQQPTPESGSRQEPQAEAEQTPNTGESGENTAGTDESNAEDGNSDEQTSDQPVDPEDVDTDRSATEETPLQPVQDHPDVDPQAPEPDDINPTESGATTPPADSPTEDTEDGTPESSSSPSSDEDSRTEDSDNASEQASDDVEPESGEPVDSSDERADDARQEANSGTVGGNPDAGPGEETGQQQAGSSSVEANSETATGKQDAGSEPAPSGDVDETGDARADSSPDLNGSVDAGDSSAGGQITLEDIADTSRNDGSGREEESASSAADVPEDADSTVSDSDGGTTDETAPGLESEPINDDEIEMGESASESAEEENTESAVEPGTGDDETPDEAPFDPDLDSDSLEREGEQAEQEAMESGPDPSVVEDELNDLGELFDDADPASDPASDGGGSGAGGGNLTNITTPDVDPTDPLANETVAKERVWKSIVDDGKLIADTLADVLSLDKQTDIRRSQTSGSVDAASAYRLSYGDPRTFTRGMPGDEKEYVLVLIMDRSGSMGGIGGEIEAATRATAMFAAAAEELDIKVAVVDFYDDEARLVKPFSVDVEYVLDRLLSTETAGGTPLSDALSLAKRLVQRRSYEPLIMAMTDGKPASPEKVEDQLGEIPVCSLTLATTRSTGSPPRKAQELEGKWTASRVVYDKANLTDELDYLASLLTGL